MTLPTSPERAGIRRRGDGRGRDVACCGGRIESGAPGRVYRLRGCAGASRQMAAARPPGLSTGEERWRRCKARSGFGARTPATRSEGCHGPHNHRDLAMMADRTGPQRARRSERPPPARQEREVWIYGSAVFGVVAPDETEAKRSARQRFLPGHREIDLPRVRCEARIDGRMHDLPRFGPGYRKRQGRPDRAQRAGAATRPHSLCADSAVRRRHGARMRWSPGSSSPR